MKSFVLLPAVLAAAVLLIAATASAAGAAPKGEFKAQFHDDDCVAHTLCGTGLVEGYGQVTTTLDLTGGDFDPSTGCLINATAIRDIELVGDPLSTLTLALTDHQGFPQTPPNTGQQSHPKGIARSGLLATGPAAADGLLPQGFAPSSEQSTSTALWRSVGPMGPGRGKHHCVRLAARPRRDPTRVTYQGLPYRSARSRRSGRRYASGRVHSRCARAGVPSRAEPSR